MSPDELRRAIEAPAEAGGWEFSPGLVDLILHDVGEEPGALPLLSHALLETWRRRRGTVMTLKAYAESGGVRGAIARTADRVFHGELDRDQQGIAQSIFLRLTELGEGSQDTRRRVALRELVPATVPDGEAVSAVLGRLVDARLVTTSADTAEVAHEALIREWPTLRDWLSHDREALRVHRHLTEATQEWELLERDSGALYRGARLANAVEWATDHPGHTQRSGTRLPADLDGAADARGRRARDAAPARDRSGGAAGRLGGCIRAPVASARAAAHRRTRRGRRDGRGGDRPWRAGPAERRRGGTELREGREPAPRRRVEHPAPVAGQRRVSGAARPARPQRRLLTAGRHGPAARGAAGLRSRMAAEWPAGGHARRLARWQPGDHFRPGRDRAVVEHRGRNARPPVRGRRHLQRHDAVLARRLEVRRQRRGGADHLGRRVG